MLILFVLVCGIGRDTTPTPVDVAEINTVYGREGDLRFTQVILWRWTPFAGRHEHVVTQWMMVDEWGVRPRLGGRSEVWWTNGDGEHFRVSARTFWPPFKCYSDREMDNREDFKPKWRVPYHIEPFSIRKKYELRQSEE